MRIPGSKENPPYTLKILPKKPESPPARYKERLFAFVDILGFGDLVENTRNDPIQLNRLKQILEVVAEFNTYGSDRTEPLPWSMVFSDSIVISEEKSLVGLLNILSNLAIFSWRMLGLHRLVRGAITSGQIYHSGSIVFGPALIEAYRMEQEIAFYPRIIVANKLASTFDSLPSGYKRDLPNDLVKVCQLHLRRDHDGLQFVDYLNLAVNGYPALALNDQVVALGGHNLDCLRPVRSWLENELSEGSMSFRPRDMKIIQKFKWLQHYLDKTTEENK